MSDAPGTVLGFRKLLFSYYHGEKRWPKSPSDLKAFAANNSIPFNLQDYPELVFIPEPESNRLRYSYKLDHRLTLSDVLDPPDANVDQPNLKDSAP
jgi:hypothetical protein